MERVSCPIILFQGLEDKIVPPDQSEKFYTVLRDKGLPTAYLAYEGEQHGFRKAETIKRSIEAELYFYAKVFGFEPLDQIEPVHIANLETAKRTPMIQEALRESIGDSKESPHNLGSSYLTVLTETGFENYRRRVINYYGEKKYSEALGVAREASKKFPDYDAKTSFWIACFQSRLGDHDEAVRTLRAP